MNIGWPGTEKEKMDRDRFRSFLKDTIRKEFDFSRVDQNMGISQPLVQKPVDEGNEIFSLPFPDDWSEICRLGLGEVLGIRRSRRSFEDESLSLEELSFLLWATQGVKSPKEPFFRTSPSAGARHSFETYIIVRKVTGLEEGLYRYLPLEHSLVLVRKESDMSINVAKASFGQSFIGTGSVVFLWTAIPYRMEWGEGPAAYKVIAIDIGHVCQNLYLASEGIGCGTCAIGAYDQEALDSLIGVDGNDEFTIYLAPIGRIK